MRQSSHQLTWRRFRGSKELRISPRKSTTVRTGCWVSNGVGLTAKGTRPRNHSPHGRKETNKQRKDRRSARKRRASELLDRDVHFLAREGPRRRTEVPDGGGVGRGGGDSDVARGRRGVRILDGAARATRSWRVSVCLSLSAGPADARRVCCAHLRPRPAALTTLQRSTGRCGVGGG